MTKKKFGFFALHFFEPIGGAERSMKKYFESLSNDLDIEVFCFLDTNGKRFTENKLFFENGIKINQFCGTIDQAVAGYIEKNNPNFIGTQLLGSEKVVELCSFYKVPCFYFVHGLFEDICKFYLTNHCPHNSLTNCLFGDHCANGLGLKKSLEKYLNCEKVFVNSIFTKNMFKRFFPILEENNKIELLYPFVEIDTFKFYRKKEKKKNVLAVNSNFTKGRDFIIKIAQYLKEYNFTIVNTKDNDISFFKNIKNIKTIGYLNQKEMWEEYKKSDVTIIPTLMDETFCMVALESILSGTPVVSSRKGNLPNIVINGLSGFVVDSYDVWDWVDYIEKGVDLNINEKICEEYRCSYDFKNGLKILKNYLSIEDKKNYNDFNDLFFDFFGVKWYE